MKSPTYQFSLPARAVTLAVEAVILYEDLATGINGKVFCELLAEEIDPGCTVTNSLWRMSILDHSPIAAQATSRAAGSDFIVVSMLGDEELSTASQRWLELQTRAPDRREQFVVLLTRAQGALPEIAERSRKWLSNLCRRAEVDFFAYQGELIEDADEVCFFAKEQIGPRVLREREVPPLQLATV